ncbi:multidrug DMT transporter permease [Bosea sp. AAP35]|uniref:DMT family transporter n=1 Tax=Bosea sp. AAP35 TaxID=1523417 RepID=UPI0006B9609E|nr:DMT family transporter [Bosea sp. AAP35]KPF67370.1 multidrug DMT transporter permease [Bosea sp. AAP35]
MPNLPHPEPTRVPPGPALSHRRDAPLRAIGLVLVTGIFFTAADAASKVLTADMSAVQVIWLRYGTFAAIMLAMVWRAGGARVLRTQRPVLQILRGLGVTLSSILFTLGLQYLPIADATASSFIAPLFVTALSIPILGETIGWRRWCATLVGLTGVLIVVRPGGSGFQSASLLPVASALSWAFAMIITRMMSRTESPLTTLTYSAVIGFVLVSLVVPFIWQPMTWPFLLLGLFIGVSSTVGHWLLVTAFRYADASLLAPFSYLQLLWASIFGYLLFAVLPDSWTLVGAVIIAASGLYTAHRERIRARALR